MYDQGFDEYYEDIDGRAEYEAMCEAEAQAEAEDYAARAENEQKQLDESEV